MNSLRITLLTLLCLLPAPALAWDAIGHRLTAAVASTYLRPDTQQRLADLLAQHPRYAQDFLAQMPASLQRAGAEEQLTWLLGQAAYWPDIARGLPGAEARRYNRPDWHYIDGAWLRDEATIQGNVYITIAAFPAIPGEAAATIRRQDQVHNVMTALDYNTRLLADPERPAADRAVALCWVLHLMGDIHQPLHSGSLYSARVFASGDRGGNGIDTDGGNLHARWDRALASEGINSNLQRILAQLNGVGRPQIDGVDSDWSLWLNESRELLQRSVYSDAMKAAIAAADERGTGPGRQQLGAGYVSAMQRSARQRLGLAGLRIAIWLENELP